MVFFFSIKQLLVPYASMAVSLFSNLGVWVGVLVCAVGSWLPNNLIKLSGYVFGLLPTLDPSQGTQGELMWEAGRRGKSGLMPFCIVKLVSRYLGFI